MQQSLVYGGQELRGMFQAGAIWVEKAAPDINALNVFPVPDGDCGTNMLLTTRNAVAEAYRAPDSSASGVAQAMAYGALMGARGNSGVILSQVFRGLAKGLENKDSFSGPDFAAALTEASRLAYKSITNPTEGTILTVVKEAANAAQEACTHTDHLVPILEAATAAAKEAVANTPNLLPVLREAGVVDAGGQGFYTLLEGALRYLKGETEGMPYQRPQIVPTSEPLIARTGRGPAEKEEPYGYCAEFVLEGNRISTDRIKKRLADKGKCLMVVGDERLAHIHIHTFDPGGVLRYATGLGRLHEIKIENMDDQHKEFLQAAKSKAPTASIAMITVASGEGIREVFRSLGADSIVSGGQTMNPSTQELLHAVESVPQNEVIILPNNKNIIPAASQVPALTSKKVAIVPTETIPQGIAAIVSFNYDAELETNVSTMKQAISGVKTVEITQAARSTQFREFKIMKKQAMGLLDGELVATASTSPEALWEVLSRLDVEHSELVTIYYGGNTKRGEAEEVTQRLQQRYPRLELELIYGGQPHYDYIVSVE